MKVNDPNLPGINSPGLNRSGGAQKTENTGQNHGASGTHNSGLSNDNVQLSTLSGKISSLSSDHPDRTALIEQLAADVANGSYKVDSKALSKGIIKDAV